jgi:hypothetical protein
MLILNWGSRVCSIALLLILAACSSTNKIESNLGLEDVPNWVNKGTQTLNNQDGRLFHGVGQASAMGDMALQKSVADDRARAEVARIFSSFLDIVSNDYVTSEKVAHANVNTESVSRQIKNLSKVNLSGSRIIGSYRDTKNNIIYSIAELDIKRVKETLESVNDMNEDLRRYINAHADNVFDTITKGKK